MRRAREANTTLLYSGEHTHTMCNTTRRIIVKTHAQRLLTLSSDDKAIKIKKKQQKYFIL